MNPPETATIAALRQQCDALQQELEQQRHCLHADWQHDTFEQLQTLLVYFPTARCMAQTQPDLPARQLTSLFLPLEHWLNQAGIEAIGSVWEQVPYDPQRHEADENDLTAGELVYVRFVGYQRRNTHQDGSSDQILCPAKVSRTLPWQEAEGRKGAKE